MTTALRTIAGRAAVLFAAGLLLAGSPALAEAPDRATSPTVEDLYQQAKQALAEAAAIAEAARRDPNREAITAFQTGKSSLDQYKRLTEIINDAKDEKLQPYRQLATDALIERFRAEPVDDPIVRRIRADVALEVLDLMKASSSDELGLSLIQSLLYTWWKTKMNTEIRFKAGDKWRDRARAHRRMKAYLSAGERE